MTSRPDLKLLISTLPERDVAERIAEIMVEERLAACVQVLPGLTSIYRWEGKIERGEELLLLVKTTRPGACMARLETLHPYDVPEILVVDVDGGLTAYLDWASSECDPEKH